MVRLDHVDMFLGIMITALRVRQLWCPLTLSIMCHHMYLSHLKFELCEPGPLRMRLAAPRIVPSGAPYERQPQTCVSVSSHGVDYCISTELIVYCVLQIDTSDGHTRLCGHFPAGSGPRGYHPVSVQLLDAQLKSGALFKTSARD